MTEKSEEKKNVPIVTKATQSRQDSAGTGSSSSSSSASNVRAEEEKTSAKNNAESKTENLYLSAKKKISAPISASYDENLTALEEKLSQEAPPAGGRCRRSGGAGGAILVPLPFRRFFYCLNEGDGDAIGR